MPRARRRTCRPRPGRRTIRCNRKTRGWCPACRSSATRRETVRCHCRGAFGTRAGIFPRPGMPTGCSVRPAGGRTRCRRGNTCFGPSIRVPDSGGGAGSRSSRRIASGRRDHHRTVRCWIGRRVAGRAGAEDAAAIDEHSNARVRRIGFMEDKQSVNPAGFTWLWRQAHARRVSRPW